MFLIFSVNSSVWQKCSKIVSRIKFSFLSSALHTTLLQQLPSKVSNLSNNKMVCRKIIVLFDKI